MPLLTKLKGLVVINKVDDDEIPIEVKEMKKKEEKMKEPPPTQPEEDPLYKTTHKELTWKDTMLYNRWYQLGYIMFLCFFLGILLPFILTSTVFKNGSDTTIDRRGYCYIIDEYKYSCFHTEVNESTCVAADCCFIPSPDANVPWCYHTTPSEYGYTIHNSTVTPTFSSYVIREPGLEGWTDLNIKRSTYRLEDSNSISFSLNSVKKNTLYGGESWNVSVLIERSGNDYIRISMYSPGNEEGTLMKDNTNFPTSPADNPKLDIEVVEDEGGAFNLTVYRRDTNEHILRTIFGPFIMGNGDMEVTTTILPSAVYGLGSAFPHSSEEIFDEYKSGTMNSIDPSFFNHSLTDTHPFYLAVESETSNAFGVYMQTAAPVQINAVPAPGLSYKTNLGSFKLVVMAGLTVKEVSKQYTALVGLPVFPPYWAFGFHLCRTVEEKNQKETYKDVYEAMIDTLPFESDCLDSRLSYPDPYKKWSDTWISEAILQLHDDERKFILPNYPFLVSSSATYNDSLASDLLLKLPEKIHYYGKVSNEVVGYLDYMNEETTTWMSGNGDVMDRIRSADALFLLQNAPLNEAVIDYGMSENVTDSCDSSHPELCCRFPPYNFTVDPSRGVISNGTICWEVIHSTMGNSHHLAHHNSYGYYHTSRVSDVFKQAYPSKRAVIVSSSTHPGSGTLGGHFSEGFGNSIDEQKRALQSVLNLNLAGMSLVGVPACGSVDDDEVDLNEDEWYLLCTRSYQMSIFFPLFMSHYEMGHQARNPPDVRDGFPLQLQPYILLRYSLLPTFYTLAEQNSRLGIPMVRSMGYEFPDDQNSTWTSDQFMFGSSLMIVPNFENSTDVTVQVPVYYPPGIWYEFFSGMVKSDDVNGSSTFLPTVSTDVNVLFRGGEAVFLQGNLHENFKTAEKSRIQDYHIMIAATADGSEARGEMYYDDGETPKTEANYKATLVTVTLTPQTKTLTVAAGDAYEGYPSYCGDKHSSKLTGVIIYGLKEIGSVTDGDGNDLEFTLDATGSNAVSIQGVNFDWCNGPSETTIHWTYKE